MRSIHIYVNLDSFSVLLIDQHGKPVANANKIPLTIGIYSSENTPKHIDINTAGKIYKKFLVKSFRQQDTQRIYRKGSRKWCSDI
jgi:hypothetical protein